MSSGFVSAGTNEKPIERDNKWRKAQEVIEVNFRRKQEEGKQDEGKSLYDVLQQNKGDLPDN
jgi:FAM192A/Fyv6, N-terminal domain